MMFRSALGLAVTCALALPVLASSGDVQAATKNWSNPGITATQNDGVALDGVSLQGMTVMGNASMPYFLLNGQRYELAESGRVAGPFVAEADGFQQVYTTYHVQTAQGLVKATLIYALMDEVADSDSLEAQLSSWVKFEGPRGDYRFFWRMDTDLGSRQDNVLERGTPQGMAPMTQEGMVELSKDGARMIDTRSYQQQGQLNFAPNPLDHARLYAVQYHPGEYDANPETLINGEPLTGKPDGDIVLWYETRLNGVSAGMTGPDMYLVAAMRVNAIVEEDRMVSTAFIDETANVYGESRSLQTAFATASINVVDIKQDKSNIPDDSSSTNAELHSIMTSNKTYESQDSSSQWYSWVGVVVASSSGPSVLGIMFDDGSTNTDGKPRQGCAVFYNAHQSDSWPDGDTPQAELLLTMTHETGHVYNQHHEDFCAGKFSGSTFRNSGAIMSYAFMDTSVWTFSKGSITTMSSEPAEYSRPGTGYAFTSNGSYNMTDAHSAKHSTTSCRRFCCLNQ